MTVGDNGDILAALLDDGFADGKQILLIPYRTQVVVEVLMLKIQHRIVASYCTLEQGFCISGTGRCDNDQAGDVGEHRLQALGMLRPVSGAAADRRTKHHRSR